MKTDEEVITSGTTPLRMTLRMIGGTGTSVVCATDDGVCTVAQPDPE